LTWEANDYNQHGAYLLAVFDGPPTARQVFEVIYGPARYG
jgi:hypothetical protein